MGWNRASEQFNLFQSFIKRNANKYHYLSNKRWAQNPRHFRDYNSSIKDHDMNQRFRTFRYPIPWRDPLFYNEEDLEQETRRVFDICNSCRLCYSLCDSFPQLFTLIDESKSGELDHLPSSSFKKVIDSCTLCDLCFINKCPYTPPHPFNIDFPHLMLRNRAIAFKKENLESNQFLEKEEKDIHHDPKWIKDEQDSSIKWPSVKGTFGIKSDELNYTNTKVNDQVDRRLSITHETLFHKLYTNMDLMGQVMSRFSWIINWLVQSSNNTNLKPSWTRLLLSIFGDIHPSAKLPTYVKHSRTLVAKYKSNHSSNTHKEGNDLSDDRKRVVIYATCTANYNKPQIGEALQAVLEHNGIRYCIEYGLCCGMPQWESGKIKNVTTRALKISHILKDYIQRGYDVVTPVSSCSLMLKKEWPLLLPEDPNIIKVSKHTYDASEYLVHIKKTNGLVDIPPLEASVTLHHACHARVQNTKFESQQLLQLIPKLNINNIEKCSGHGGTFGVQNEGFKIANKVGKPVFNHTLNAIMSHSKGNQSHFLVSDCPLAVEHIKQGVEALALTKKADLSKMTLETKHPVEILAMAYGLIHHNSHKSTSTAMKQGFTQ